MRRIPYLNNLNRNGNVYLPFMDNHFRIYGCQLPYTSIVKYDQGFISYYEKSNNSIGVSFEFSGCAMAQFSYLDKTFIAHISLHPPGNVYDTRNNWNLFLRKIVNHSLGNRYKDFILFKPFDNTALVIMSNHGINYDCCGIIDQQDVCYSAVISKTNGQAIKMWRRNNIVQVHGQILTNNVSQLLL